MAEVVAVSFYAAKGDAAEPVDFKDQLALMVGWVRIRMHRCGGGCGLRDHGGAAGRSCGGSGSCGGGRRGRRIGEGDVDVGFFARADHLPGRVQGFALEVRVQREVVETAVGEAVAVVCWDLTTR